MNRYKKEDLERLLIEENKSYLEVGRMYGVSGNAVKKAALRLGLALPYRRAINSKETFGKGIIKNEVGECINCGKPFVKYSNKSNKYCSIKCQREFRHKEGYKN